jgi:hypothetical protein
VCFFRSLAISLVFNRIRCCSSHAVRHCLRHRQSLTLSIVQKHQP